MQTKMTMIYNAFCMVTRTKNSDLRITLPVRMYSSHLNYKISSGLYFISFTGFADINLSGFKFQIVYGTL